MWFGLIIGILTREHNLCSVSEAPLNKVAFCTKDFEYQAHNRKKAKLAFTAASQILFFFERGGGWEPPCCSTM
jgi:hypothetical protein